MSLDARMRQIAREEASAPRDPDAAAQYAVNHDRVGPLEAQVADLQTQLKDLHGHLHRALTQVGQLDERLKTLEAAGATGHPAETETAPRRTSSRRKSGES